MYRTYDGTYIDYGEDDEREDWQQEHEARTAKCVLCHAPFEYPGGHDSSCPLYRERTLPF